MPCKVGDYKDFSSCVRANKDKDSPEAYCAVIKTKSEMLRECEKLSSEIDAKENPIQANPVNVLNKKVVLDEGNVPDDKEPNRLGLMGEIAHLERFLK